MGLDMYAYSTPRTDAVRAVDAKLKNFSDVKELHYWRKHPDLHGWMADLYYLKGGQSDCFNCDTVELTLEDLDRLEAAIRAGELPPTRGFFFGESDGSEIEDDLEFVRKAREAIQSGRAVFYDSWW